MVAFPGTWKAGAVKDDVVVQVAGCVDFAGFVAAADDVIIAVFSTALGYFLATGVVVAWPVDSLPYSRHY